MHCCHDTHRPKNAAKNVLLSLSVHSRRSRVMHCKSVDVRDKTHTCAMCVCVDAANVVFPKPHKCKCTHTHKQVDGGLPKLMAMAKEEEEAKKPLKIKQEIQGEALTFQHLISGWTIKIFMLKIFLTLNKSVNPF